MMFIQLQLEQQSKEKRKSHRHRVVKATSSPATSLSANKQRLPNSPKTSNQMPSNKKNSPITPPTSIEMGQKNTDELLRKYCQKQSCLIIPNQHQLTNEITQIINAAGTGRTPRIPTQNSPPTTSSTTNQQPSNAPKNGHAPTTSSKLSSVTLSQKGAIQEAQNLRLSHPVSKVTQQSLKHHSQKPQTQATAKTKDEKAQIDTFTSHAPCIFSGTFSGTHKWIYTRYAFLHFFFRICAFFGQFFIFLLMPFFVYFFLEF